MLVSTLSAIPFLGSPLATRTIVLLSPSQPKEIKIASLQYFEIEVDI